MTKNRYNNRNLNFIETIQAYNLTPFQWFLAIVSAILVGIGKSGLNSVSVITVTTCALVFGGKVSTGILLPMLIVGDTLAVWHYKRDADWSSLLRLAPWVVIGILAGVFIGRDLDEAIFRKMMACIVLVVVFTLFWFERRPLENVSNARWFSASMGIATGFTSMVGNQASGFSNVYLLSMRLKKNHFIGTNAWLFLFVNCFKLPFHIFSWHTVNAQSVQINLLLIPFLLIGFFSGIYLIQRINEKNYRQIILWLTALSALFVFV